MIQVWIFKGGFFRRVSKSAARRNEMDEPQFLGIGIFEFPEVTVTAIGIRFSLDADSLPVTDSSDRESVQAVRKQARSQGIRSCETVFSGRDLPADPWKFRVYRSREFGLAYDLHEPGRPPRIGLQSPQYREYWRHELRLLNERDGITPQADQHSREPKPMDWIEAMDDSDRQMLAALLSAFNAGHSLHSPLDKRNAERLARAMRRLGVRAKSSSPRDLNEYLLRLLGRLEHHAKAGVAGS